MSVSLASPTALRGCSQYPLMQNAQRVPSARWADLPSDLSCKIFKMLGQDDQCSFMLICNAWSMLYLNDGVLDFSIYPGLRDKQLIAMMPRIKEHLKNAKTPVHSINFRGCFFLTEKGLSVLKDGPFTHINVDGCHINYACIKKIKSLPQVKQIHLGKIYRDISYMSLTELSDEELSPLRDLPIYPVRRRSSVPLNPEKKIQKQEIGNLIDV